MNKKWRKVIAVAICAGVLAGCNLPGGALSSSENTVLTQDEMYQAVANALCATMEYDGAMTMEYHKEIDTPVWDIGLAERKEYYLNYQFIASVDPATNRSYQRKKGTDVKGSWNYQATNKTFAENGVYYNYDQTIKYTDNSVQEKYVSFTQQDASNWMKCTEMNRAFEFMRLNFRWNIASIDELNMAYADVIEKDKQLAKERYITRGEDVSFSSTHE